MVLKLLALDRELFFVAVALAVCGAAFFACGFWPPAGGGIRSLSALERRRWRQIWLPLLPGAICLAALVGWAFHEPEPPTVRAAPVILVVFAGVASIPIGRASLRALLALLHSSNEVLAATVGILSRYVVLSPRLIHALDRAALDAVYEHELAHVRHRDPLRIWLAQLACDLQWPWPAAKWRLTQWQEALEMVRDEEARAHGANGEDLASGILTAARLARDGAPIGIAGIAGDGEAMKQRIANLLAPVGNTTIKRCRAYVFLAFLIVLVGAGTWGTTWGHPMINCFLKALP